jgi:hypothetical protein
VTTLGLVCLKIPCQIATLYLFIFFWSALNKLTPLTPLISVAERAEHQAEVGAEMVLHLWRFNTRFVLEDPKGFGNNAQRFVSVCPCDYLFAYRRETVGEKKASASREKVPLSRDSLLCFYVCPADPDLLFFSPSIRFAVRKRKVR